MLIYLLKSTACMAIFLLFYKLLLEKENMHTFKRCYLILALVASCVIPGLVFIEYVEPTVTAYSNTNTFVQTSNPIITETAARDIDVINWSLIAWSIYSIGVVVFGVRFLRNLFQILNRIRKNTKLKERFSIKVLVLEQLPPHTFFKYIFLNKEKFEANSIPKEVLLHEEIHAKQRHSIDVIFIEFLQVILWFNPLIFFFKKCIKLNHEFLADSAVIKKTISRSNYQNTLLSYLSQDSLEKYQSVNMVNAINYSSIKKRFKVMKTHTSKQAILLRSLLLLPLLALMLYGFTETKFIEKEISVPIVQQNLSPKEFILSIANDEIFLNGKEVELVVFAQEVDELTRDWEETDYTSVIAQTTISETSVVFLEKVEFEFQKTHFSKANEGMKVFPEGYTINIPKEGTSTEKNISGFHKIANPIRININGKGKLLVQEYLVPIQELGKFLLDYNSSLTKTEREEMIRASIKVEVNTPKNIIAEVETILKEYGVAMVDVIGPEEKINVQKGASREQLQEYNALAKKYNEMDRNDMRILIKDVEQLKYIYSIMSDKQKADTEPFPDFPEPPPAPDAPNAREEASNKIKEMIEEQDPYDVVGGSIMNKPPAPSSPRVINGQASTIPAPPSPPIPPSPLDLVIDMAKKGATFYYEGKKISSDKAIELIKKNKSLNISTTKSNSKNPQVRISKEAIKIGSLNKQKDLLNYAKELRNKKARFYYNDEHISAEEGVVYIAAKEYDYVETLPWINKTPEVKIYSK
ncbi:M56 family metallopeptidase [Croceitalea sp. P059]|uniref:M56 family metallopeptidase n=1 Tax=Croceitalea sp. P059 TaxID=3075601 RepID=UPI002886D575|nr:M56 family metallopeptidase [Croceitalea sp. P059]MDT0539143.1 M56 family metallopeptidase [Croceitalea sp. P059]